MRLVAVVVVAATIVCSPLSAYANPGDQCAGAGLLEGCPNVGGSIEGDSALLNGDLTLVGAPGGSAGGSGGSAPGGGNGAGSPLPPMPCEEVFAGLCYGEGQDKPGDGTASPSIPPLTLSDVAAFRPQAPRQSMQPDGWMVVGLPTNIYARTGTHIVSGTLLGSPADVRFTPVGYRWRYGDSSAARLATPGATWQALGLREFDATPTSHVYRAPGTYVIELDVEFTAEYRFAGGAWWALSGVLVVPANDLVAVAGSAVTVLVDRDCATAPHGPGC
ncbi:MAG: hypothetical protein LDL15_01065 [Yonghaparkia sp.]|nr:hypothetical protein [Microcella sp.]